MKGGIMIAKVKSLFVLGVWMLMATTAFAQSADSWRQHRQETVELSGSRFVLNPGQTKSISVGGWYHVRTVVIRAEGLTRSGGKFEVLANGRVKVSPFEVPGRDPSYLVDLNEAVKTIELRHISGGRIQIYDVKVTRASSGYFSEEESWELPVRYRNDVAAQARRVISIVDELGEYANHADFGRFLLPVKKDAGRLYAVATARGELSSKTRRRACALLAEIIAAERFLDNAFEIKRAFRLAIELLRIKERLEDRLD
jgi:hypothetical protein